MNTVYWWGFSMYGGYYAEILEETPDRRTLHHSYHTEKLRDLRAILARYGLKASPAHRLDN